MQTTPSGNTVPGSTKRRGPTLLLLAAMTATVLVTGGGTADAAKTAGPPQESAHRTFDLEGHRGTRGLRPEDTLPAFGKALDIGVTTLELDTGITRDGVVIVSHERLISPLVCADTAPVAPGDPQFPYVGKYYKDLTFAQVESVDCGQRHPVNPSTDPFYASQLPIPGTRIPTLDQVFSLVEQRHAESVQLNIETKIDPTLPTQTVGPDEFVAKLVQVMKRHPDGVARSLLQSFDWRTLQVAQHMVPSLRRVALASASTAQVGLPGASPWLGGADVDQAPYNGDIAYAATSVGATVLSPSDAFLTDPMIASAHLHHQLVVPYTVDDVRSMSALISRGVDGLISDYPDRLRDVLGSLDIALPRAYPAR
ncbi:MAG: glycerophosphodiester phosphodiesterase family protein [Mycobacteriaceae bacterium]